MTTAAAISSSMDFSALIEAPGVTQVALAAHLDPLDAAGRVLACRTLSKGAQKRLWEVCEGAPTFSLDDLVPPALGEGQEVIFAGKNSLAAFTHFEKRFARMGGKVVGYNHQAMSFVTGPGYFTVKMSPEHPNELWFDYTDIPSSAPANWPSIRSNTGAVSRMVYGNMFDYCRRVSKDVVIGFATRGGKPMDSYFVLARS